MPDTFTMNHCVYSESELSQTFPPLFVINLAAYQQRRQFMCTQLNRLSLPYTIIDAVGEQDISAQELPKIYSRDQAQLYVGRDLSLAEIGCYLSHLKAMQAIIDSGAAYGVVIEDDAKIQPEFVEVVMGIKAIPPVWKIIQIGDSISYNFRNKKSYELPQGYRMGALLPESWRTTGYVIHRNFCQYVLHNAYPIFCPIDTRLFSIFLSFSFFHSLQGKFLVYHDETLESTIQSTRAISRHEGAKRLEAKKVPPPHTRNYLQGIKSFIFDRFFEYLLRLLVYYYPIPKRANKRKLLLPYKSQLRIKQHIIFLLRLLKTE